MKEVIKMNQTKKYNSKNIWNIVFIYHYEDIENENYNIEGKSNIYIYKYIYFIKFQ